MSASNFAPLFGYVRSLVGEGPGRLPSAVIGVADRSGILDVHAFNATEDAIYLLFSVTKPFVGLAMCQLWERGQINLNDPLRNYVPDFAPARTDSVTLWHLLTHTSGIDQAAFELQRTPSFPDAHVINPRTLMRLAPMQFLAGTHRLYNNLAFWAMQEVIETVSGMPLQAYLAQNVFAPLGAKDFSFFSQIESHARVMPTHNSEKLINYARYVQQESPAAGLFSTAQGLLTVGSALLNGGGLNGQRILAPMTLREMTRPQTRGIPLANPDQDHMFADWGLTFQLNGNRTFIIGDNLFGHNGWGGCKFWIYPDQGVCFALMTNLMDAGLLGIDLDRVHNVFAACLG